jgi:hypothetical protein
MQLLMVKIGVQYHGRAQETVFPTHEVGREVRRLLLGAGKCIDYSKEHKEISQK